jgi:hypothetical protein
LPVTAPGAAGITGFMPSAPAATFSGGFAEADYLALPWAMTIMRWDQVKSSADRINFIQYNPIRTSGIFVLLAVFGYAQPVHSRRAVPHPRQHQASIEYQIMPQQIVYNPATGEVLTGPFRTNA